MEKSIQNIKRALSSKRNYTVIVIYVYQSPKLTIEFIKKRAEKTGRDVPFDAFKDSFLHSIENVKEAKKRFKEKIIIFSVEKNLDRSLEKYTMNLDESALQKLYERVAQEHSQL